MRRPISVIEQKPARDDVFGWDFLSVLELQGVWSLFGLMGIAEEEIAGQVKLLVHRGEEHRAAWLKRHGFLPLVPTPLLRDKSPQVYRAHARELVGRMAHSQAPLEDPTRAEVLCFISGMSQKAPLATQWAALADHLFEKVMPDHPVEGERTPEPYQGSNDELLGELRRKLQVPNRTMPQGGEG